MKQKTREGAASIFVVIFTTLLLGIVTLSFVRIMVSEANQTTNYDLAQSAYDSALAGVEDAKVALLKYHECLNSGTNDEDCQRAIGAITAVGSDENCDIVHDMLRRPRVEGAEETVIQSGNVIEDGTVANTMEQAYTCVKISENTQDYLGRLNGNYRTKIVPIRVGEGDLGNVNRIRLEWFNSQDEDEARSVGVGFEFELKSTDLLTNKKGYDQDYRGENSRFSDTLYAPPFLQVQLIQTDVTFMLSQFDTNGPVHDGLRTNRGTLMLRPSSGGTEFIGSSAVAGFASSADKSLNNPIDVKCDEGEDGGYWCGTDIRVPGPNTVYTDGIIRRNDGTMFLRLVLPYGQPDTSFSVKLYDCENADNVDPVTAKCTRVIEFVGVQAKVDSTGRANDLFRRVESRVELVDTYFPYPEFSADLNGGGDDSIWKNYWVTRNCWTMGPNDPDDNGIECVNSGNVGS